MIKNDKDEIILHLKDTLSKIYNYKILDSDIHEHVDSDETLTLVDSKVIDNIKTLAYNSLMDVTF